MDSTNKIDEKIQEEEKNDAQKRWLNNMMSGAFTKNSPNNK